MLSSRGSESGGDICDLLVAPVGSEDPEREKGSSLQKLLSQVTDDKKSHELHQYFVTTESWGDASRLDELQDHSVSHEWLWMLHPGHGDLVPPDEFSDAVRVRLGAKFIDDVAPCERCGKLLSSNAAHALCCALPDATRGHNRVRDKVHDLVSIADPSASREAPELVTSFPTIRPADIFTETALPGGRTALDIGVATPGTCTAGNDCCDSMWSERFHHYREALPEMAGSGIHYVPLIFSCYGRAHPEAACMLENLAKRAARCIGVGDWHSMLRRTRASIGVMLVRRCVV